MGHRQSRPLDRRTAGRVFSSAEVLVRVQASSGTSWLQQLVRRSRAVVMVELANPSEVDGFPAAHGGPGGGGGPTLVIEGDRVPATAVEPRCACGPGCAGPVLGDLSSDRGGVDQLVAKADEVEGLVLAAERLQAPTGLSPAYDWVAQSAGLPFDERWAEIHKRTTFAGYLERPLDEPRAVCRWTYDFVRTHRRLPTKDEMLQLLRTGKVKVHV